MFRQMLLGSTTAKVVNDADCPVLTSRHAETVAPRPLGHRELLCAVGLSSDSERVLRFATGIAREVHAKLTIIHALQGEASGLSVELDLEEKVRSVEKREALGRIAQLQLLVGSDAAVRVAAGELKKALLEAALLSDADVLIIGRNPPSLADSLAYGTSRSVKLGQSSVSLSAVRLSAQPPFPMPDHEKTPPYGHLDHSRCTSSRRRD